MDATTAPRAVRYSLAGRSCLPRRRPLSSLSLLARPRRLRPRPASTASSTTRSSLGAGVACLSARRDLPQRAPAWLLIGLAVLCWGAAEVYWAAQIEGNPNAPYPSPADVGYLAFYPLAYTGLALLVRARAAEMNWRLWTDGADRRARYRRPRRRLCLRLRRRSDRRARRSKSPPRSPIRSGTSSWSRWSSGSSP